MSLAALLADLPSSGTLTDPQGLVVTKAPCRVCDYDTSPPPDQVIKTDPTNILIRALTSRRGAPRDGAQKGPVAPRDTKGKRPLASVEDRLGSGEGSNKRERRDGGTPESKRGQGGEGSQRLSKAELESFTVERLKAFLKERGMPLRGRKEELLARAKSLLGYK